MTFRFQQVTIAGLGLIGGSIAKALRKRSKDLVLLAVDRGHVGKRTDVYDVVSQFIDADRLEEHRSLINSSDIVVLCQPVRIIEQQLSSYITPHRVVTDTGSTKKQLTESARKISGAEWFVPGHPMAGKEQGGFENASSELFEGRPWILCPDTCNRDAVIRVEAFVDLLGARRITMSAEQHDACVAVVSHLPQLLSSLLLVEGAERGAIPTAGPAFSDMTRVAGGDETIWRDILETNATEVHKVLRASAQCLMEIANGMAMTPPNVDVALQLLRVARQLKASLRAEPMNP
jgi:prephenate dehydrogenase